jgi:hypothetical protein
MGCIGDMVLFGLESTQLTGAFGGISGWISKGQTSRCLSIRPSGLCESAFEAINLMFESRQELLRPAASRLEPSVF